MSKFIILLCFAVWVVIALIGFADGPDDATARLANCNQPVNGWYAVKQMTKEQLRSPSTAVFPRFRGDFMKRTGECKWLVTTFVDAQNGFGAMIRSNVVMSLEYLPESNVYRSRAILIN